MSFVVDQMNTIHLIDSLKQFFLTRIEVMQIESTVSLKKSKYFQLFLKKIKLNSK